MSTRYQVRPVLDPDVFNCGLRWKVIDTSGSKAEMLGVFVTEAAAQDVSAAMETAAEMIGVESVAQVRGASIPLRVGVLDKLAEHVPNVSLSIIGLGEGATVEWVGEQSERMSDCEHSRDWGEPIGPDSFPGEDYRT